MPLVEYENPPGSPIISTPVSLANPLPITGNISTSAVANQTVVVTSGNVTVAGNVTTASEGATGAAVPGNATAIAFGNATGCLTIPTATNPLPVSGTFSPTANQTVVVTSGNVTVNGSLTSAGNVTAIVGALPAGSAVLGALVANQTVVVSSGNVTAAGAAANNATAAGNPIQASAIAISSEATAATAGQNASLVVGLEHKLIVLPHANKENMLRGNATVSTTSAGNVTGMSAQGAGNKIYITGAQAFRTDAGASLTYVTLNDSNTTGIPIPPLSGATIRYDVPLVVAANTTVTVTLNANITSALVFLQGYFGT